METPYFNFDEFKTNFLNVYEPAEDSFLLLDALEKDLNKIKNLKPTIFLEIGSGSGIIITSLAKVFYPAYFISTDINNYACETTLKCAKKNNVANKIECVNTNLASGLNDRLKKKVDILLFNPPYLPSPEEEITKNLLNRSWAGGLNGRKVIDQFLNQCLKLLSLDGYLYLLVIKENKPNELIEIMREKNFFGEIILNQRIKNEHQFIIRCKRLKNKIY